MDWATLSIFIPTFFFVSITPGMCMTLALTMGMSIGYRRTLWMMIGELLGVAAVSLAAILGIAAVMLKYPEIFTMFKAVGATYLFYLGIQMWRSRGKLAITSDVEQQTIHNDWDLVVQGFVTAIANPKGWAFMISLLPPFIDQSKPMLGQVSIMLGIILFSEFVCMTIYATGGKGLKRTLGNANNVRTMNRIAGALMCGVGVWLFLG
ncbi:Homoserine/homoserine lactone efflux protein [Vibrio thalassae]|uniref:Homoserine/homoserine lactone efflux protein n=1 Tax=Vibrio thalassae TaxID=1243014 RepID=A0A240EKU5_9VIBR|nr:LysE family translocator [Vibrio thalassae]SNX48615.1 Homoserine/homoserine lactone efflux protein [Vibrio thalassae]